jgi:hypothetical protein
MHWPLGSHSSSHHSRSAVAPAPLFSCHAPSWVSISRRLCGASPFRCRGCSESVWDLRRFKPLLPVVTVVVVSKNLKKRAYSSVCKQKNGQMACDAACANTYMIVSISTIAVVSCCAIGYLGISACRNREPDSIPTVQQANPLHPDTKRETLVVVVVVTEPEEDPS